jgi:hypothetical protein
MIHGVVLEVDAMDFVSDRGRKRDDSRINMRLSGRTPKINVVGLASFAQVKYSSATCINLNGLIERRLN